MAIQAHPITHPGTARTQNEDHVLIDSELSLFLLSDGVTHPSGAYCSAKVCKELQKILTDNRKLLDAHSQVSTSTNRQAVAELIRRAIEHVSAVIYQETQTQQPMKGVFATVCLAWVSRGYAFLGHLGDSRIYSIHDGNFSVLTRDHTYLAAMLAEGKNLDEARKVSYADNLSAAVGYQPVTRATVQVRELATGERLLLCSDGLSDQFGYNSFRAPEWAAAASDKLPELLKDHALKRNARDNLSAIVIEWDGRKEDSSARTTKNILTKMTTLRGIRLFHHLGERSLMKVLSLSDTRDIATGETLIQRGGMLNEMYIVLNGELSIDLGRGPIAATVKKGESVGEMSLFDGALPSATLVATEPTTVLALHRDQLFQAMKEDADFAARFELGVLQAVIRRLRERTEPDEELKKLQNYSVISILPPDES